VPGIYEQAEYANAAFWLTMALGASIRLVSIFSPAVIFILLAGRWHADNANPTPKITINLFIKTSVVKRVLPPLDTEVVGLFQTNAKKPEMIYLGTCFREWCPKDQR
jgi:hypothetical protein